MGYASDVVQFSGHPKILATHKTTFELTRDDTLTWRGDCIVGVKADRGCADLNVTLRDILTNDQTQVTIVLEVGGASCVIYASGSSSLRLRDRRDIVVRRSRFTSPRTLAVLSTHAASDIPRHMVQMLRSQTARGVLRIEAQSKSPNGF